MICTYVELHHRANRHVVSLIQYNCRVVHRSDLLMMALYDCILYIHMSSSYTCPRASQFRFVVYNTIQYNIKLVTRHM